MKLKPDHPRWFEWRELACKYLETDIADWELAQELALEDLGLKDSAAEQFDIHVDNWVA